jgi:hypothetical protein
MSARMRVLTVFVVSHIFFFYNSLQLLFTNQNRESQNLPPITLDLQTRMLQNFSWPLKDQSSMECRIGWHTTTSEIKDLFAEKVDCLDLERDSVSSVLLGTAKVILDCADIAHEEIEQTSLTRDVFLASDVLVEACFYQQTFGKRCFRDIQKEIGSFRKHQLSIAAGVLLVRSIMIFSILVKLLYEHEVFSCTEVSLLR